MEKFKNIENLESDIQEIVNIHSNKLQGYSEVILYCRRILKEVCRTTQQNGFKDKESEIIFFKSIKPIPLKNLIYYSRLYKIEAFFPQDEKRLKKRFLYKELKKIRRFLSSRNEFIRYIAAGHSHFDKHYFSLKDSNSMNLLRPNKYNWNEEFSSHYDLMLAKLQAYQKLTIYLNEKLNEIKGAPVFYKSTLNWTASKVAMTELIYALHSSKAINSGKVDIKQIALAFETIFDFKLGDFYRTYTEIKCRKKSRTKFIDELALNMIYRLDQDDSLMN